MSMISVVVAVIERSDRRFLIGQRRKNDTSPLKWEFPGGKIREGESPEAALAPRTFEKIAWVLPRELGAYDFLAANRELIAQLATGRIKPAEILEGSEETGACPDPATD